MHRCNMFCCNPLCASMLLRCTQTWMPTVIGETLRLYTFKVHDICVNLFGSELDKETAWPLSRAREREREIYICIYTKVHRWKYTWLTIPSLQDPLTAPGALLIFLSSPLDCLSADVPLWGSLYKTTPPILALKRTHKAPSSTRRLVFVRLEKRVPSKKERYWRHRISLMIFFGYPLFMHTHLCLQLFWQYSPIGIGS